MRSFTNSLLPCMLMTRLGTSLITSHICRGKRMFYLCTQVRGKASKSDNIIEEIPIPKGFACIYVSLAKKKDDGKFYLFAHNLHCEEGMIYTIDDDERFLNEKGYTDEEFLADNLEGKRSLPNQVPC